MLITRNTYLSFDNADSIIKDRLGIAQMFSGYSFSCNIVSFAVSNIPFNL